MAETIQSEGVVESQGELYSRLAVLRNILMNVSSEDCVLDGFILLCSNSWC